MGNLKIVARHRPVTISFGTRWQNINDLNFEPRTRWLAPMSVEALPPTMPKIDIHASLM
jgi:hypothetical protein